jgi:hypothetical protein
MNEPNAKTAAADSSRQSDVQGSLGGVPPVTSSSSATKEPTLGNRQRARLPRR